MGQIRGESASLAVPIRIREISLGGMSIHTDTEFEVGRRHQFALTLGDGAEVHLTGKIVYCRPATETDGHGGFVCGIHFVDEDPEPPAGIGGLIDKVR